MKNIRILTESAFEEIKSNLQDLAPKFLDKQAWIEKYFADKKWYIELPIQYIPANLINEKDVKLDIENSKRIYESLKHIPVNLAENDRFWSYLNLCEYWDYMNVRWEDSNIKSQQHIATLAPKYLITMYKGGPGTNGLARLWWFAHLTHDEKRDNPYELTEYLLSKQDYTYIFLNRTFSRNKKILHTVLSELISHSPNMSGDEMREFAKYISLRGSVAVLDVLGEEDIKQMVREYFTSKSMVSV
ncbi:TPA: hypothetical protein SAQ65_002556 [Bacillus cereus]|nr:hypothetical protein [Bacillus cereus]